MDCNLTVCIDNYYNKFETSMPILIATSSMVISAVCGPIFFQYLSRETYATFMNQLSYVFSWDMIPGNDSRKLLKFLVQECHIEWAKDAKIEKINDKTINIYNKNRSFLIKFDENNNETIFEADDCEPVKFIAKLDEGKLSIFSKTISKENETSLDIWQRKKTKNFISVYTASMIVSIILISITSIIYYFYSQKDYFFISLSKT